MRVRTPVIGLLLAATACSGGLEEGEEALRSGAAAPSVTASVTVAVSPSASATPAGTTPRTSIEVARPRPESEVLSPVVVRGTAMTATGQVTVRVLDAGGEELAAMEVDVSCGAGCRGTYEAQLAFFVPSAGPGSIRVSETGTQDEDRHTVEVPVTLIPGV